MPNNFLKKPNTPKYAQDLVVTWVKPNSDTALLSPPPISYNSKRYSNIKWRVFKGIHLAKEFERSVGLLSMGLPQSSY